MIDLSGKKLPTVEAVETIMAEYPGSTTEALAERLDLEPVVVEATIECLRQLRRAPGGTSIPAITCFRDDNLKSIVRCAGSKHGYI